MPTPFMKRVSIVLGLMAAAVTMAYGLSIYGMV